jgi:hypothetical protein
MTSENYDKVFKQFVNEVLSSGKTDLVVKSDPRNNELEIGTILHNGAVVIACTKKADRVVDETFASWITICMKDANDRDPYAVWTVIARPNGFIAETGDYSQNIIDAVSDYTRRGGK